jgi:hypothetical protein
MYYLIMFSKKTILYESGQAMLEYLMVLLIGYALAGGFLTSFKEFLGESFGGLGHSMTINLSVGVCPTECFFRVYKNSQGN